MNRPRDSPNFQPKMSMPMKIPAPTGRLLTNKSEPKPRSKIPTSTELSSPTKSLLKNRIERVCVICQRNLKCDPQTGKRFRSYRLISEQNNIAKRIHHVVGRDTPLPSNFICNNCETTLRQLEKRDKFVQSFEQHVSSALRTKRMAPSPPHRLCAKQSVVLASEKLPPNWSPSSREVPTTESIIPPFTMLTSQVNLDRHMPSAGAKSATMTTNTPIPAPQSQLQYELPEDAASIRNVSSLLCFISLSISFFFPKTQFCVIDPQMSTKNEPDR